MAPLIAVVTLSCSSRRGSRDDDSLARGIGTASFALLALALSFALLGLAFALSFWSVEVGSRCRDGGELLSVSFFSFFFVILRAVFRPLTVVVPVVGRRLFAAPFHIIGVVVDLTDGAEVHWRSFASVLNHLNLLNHLPHVLEVVLNGRGLPLRRKSI